MNRNEHIYRYESWFESPKTFIFEVSSKKLFSRHIIYLISISQLLTEQFWQTTISKKTKLSALMDTNHSFQALKHFLLKLHAKKMFSLCIDSKLINFGQEILKRCAIYGQQLRKFLNPTMTKIMSNKKEPSFTDVVRR